MVCISKKKRYLEHEKKALANDHEYSNVKSGVSMKSISLRKIYFRVLAINEESLAIGEGLGMIFILAILDNN